MTNRPLPGVTRRGLLRASAALGIAALDGCANPDERATGVRDVRALALHEGQLNLYGGGPTAAFAGWARQFEAAFPGIKVNITGGFSNELSPRIDAQIAASAMEADLAILQTLQDFDRWQRAGELLIFRPEGTDQIPAALNDPTGASFPTGVVAVGYAYNTKKLALDQLPRRAVDFLDPRFRDQVISTYPHDDDLTLYLYDGIVRKYGWDFMDRLLANRPRFVRGHLGVAREIAAGRATLSFDATSSQTAGMARQGAAIAWSMPAEDPVPIFTQAAAVFRRAPHPNAAKLFVTWLLAKDQQSRLGAARWSARRDVPPPEGFRSILEYNVLNSFREFVTAEKRLVELRREFQARIGPVQGEPVI